jgi:hypothetical protein
MRGSSSSKSKTFYAVLAAGFVFIIIGIASVIYTNTPLKVSIDDKLKPGLSDILTPNMNKGNTANIIIGGGSIANIAIKDPDKQTVKAQNGVSDFNYLLIAKKDGEYVITIKNTGKTELAISGYAQTKGSMIALGGQMMLIITGIIVTGLSLRIRMH